MPAERTQRIIADLAACDVRHVRVEQSSEGAGHAGFGLPAQTQQNEVVPGKYRIHNLRHNGIFITHHARKQCFLAFKFVD